MGPWAAFVFLNPKKGVHKSDIDSKIDLKSDMMAIGFVHLLLQILQLETIHC